MDKVTFINLYLARRQFQPLKIITGIGKHSQGGESKLLPATTKWLKKEGWLFEMTHPGCIYVKGVVNKRNNNK